MPADLWTDAARMAGCVLLVAAAAVPIAATARLLARRSGEPLLPKPRRWPVPWTGIELFVIFPFTVLAPMAIVEPLLSACGFYAMVYGAEVPESAWTAMRPLWSYVVFVPLWVLASIALRNALYPEWKPNQPIRASSINSRIAAGVGGWLAIHPVVASIHVLVLAAFVALDVVPDRHPLEDAFRDGRPEIDRALFVVQAAFAAPVLEEVLFRGLLLAWLLGKQYRTGVVLGIAACFAAASSMRNDEGGLTLRIGPVIFAAILLTGWVALHYTLHRKRRTFGAIYASAAFFAVVHSSVWPSPIPLFALGLGLGWLAVRTRGILAPTIVHGLFNLVSVLFVLHGN